ncbi:MAG: oligosaccharide flippase family protein [Sedimentitalea sp.]
MSLRSAFAWKILQFIAIFAVELGGLAILARVLTPLDMGIFAAAFALLRFGQFIGNFGLYNVILRQDVLDLTFRRQIVGLTATACILVTAVYIIALLIWDFGAPEATLIWLLPVIPLIAISMPASALIIREMRFKTQFRLRLVAAVLFPLCAVPLAYAGLGPISLAIGTLVSSTVYAVMVVWATGRTFLVRPSLRVGLPMLQFASTLFVLNGVREAREATITLLIGRLAGLGMLGQYNRAVELEAKSNQIISETIMPVLTPHLFNQARQSKDHLRAEVLRSLEYITAIAWPLGCVVVFLGPALVALVLGDQWTLAGQIFSILGYALAIQSFGAIASTAAVALKCERRLLAIAVVNLLASLGVVVVLAAQDIIATLFALVLVQYAVVAVQFWVIAAPLALAPTQIAQRVWRSFGVTACVAFAVWGMGQFSAGSSAFVVVLLGLIASVALWLVGLCLTRHPLLAEVRTLLCNLWRPKNVADPEV